MIPLLLALALQAPPDTAVFTLDEALQRALNTAPVLSAAQSRAEAAGARTRQARNWGNPTLQITTENLGSQAEITGYPGLRGTEGQLLLGASLPLGGDRSARISRSRAEERAMRATTEMVEADLRLQLMEASAQTRRDRALALYTLEEAQGLEQLAKNLQRQAQSGRVSEGEAARAHLAAVASWTEYSRALARSAASTAELNRMLGLEPVAEVDVIIPSCSLPMLPQGGSIPEAVLARARTEAAEGRVREAKAAAIPDLRPQVGLRRSGGVSAVYVGMEIPLPLFDRNQGAREAARLDQVAIQEEGRGLMAELRARREAALRALEASEATGARFTEGWIGALERTVESAEARFRLGEGSLTELLDSRKARSQALSDYERWKAERFAWRARVARLSGHPLTERSICPASTDEPTGFNNESRSTLEDIR